MSEDIRLRPVTVEDLEPFHAFEQDAEAARRSRFRPRARERFLAHWQRRILGDPTCLVRTVVVDGEPVGHVIAWWEETGSAAGDRRRFLGYWLGRPYWGRGIGTEAVAAFLREERARPLYADPFAGNTASVRLLERLGFQHAGTVRHGDDEHALLVLLPAPEESAAGQSGR